MSRGNRPNVPRRCAVALLLTLGTISPSVASAQTRGFEIGGHVASSTLREFSGHDTGIGARAGWRPGGMLAFDAELTAYPSNFPDPFAFTRSRTEGLFGVTIGPTFGRVRPFGKVRPGFVKFGEAPEPIACIAIFPPPLSCTLAAGATLFALDLGGGVEVSITPKTFVRVDIGDRAVRYRGPTFDASRRVREDSFFSHDFRIAVGAGLRF